MFFTGKGGVGKTALACATAIRLADANKRSVERLWALNIDPERASDEYRERVVSPYLRTWSETQVAELWEQLAGSCTVEIAAFDEFVELLSDDEQWLSFEHVVFDIAPTGHTLRLLSLPRAWTGFLHSATQGASCLGPHRGLKMQEERFAAAVAVLADSIRTTVVLVTRPDNAALREVARTSSELQALDIKNQHLAINAVFTPSDSLDAVAVALSERGMAKRPRDW